MNLLCYVESKEDACAFYRGFQPIGQLRKIMPNLRLDFIGKELYPSTVSHADVVFFQRPATHELLKAMQICKNCGVKVWVDFDDNLLEVPWHSPAYSRYKDDKTKRLIVDILNLADAVSVSTHALMSAYFKVIHDKNKPLVVIPNAFNDYLFHFKRDKTPGNMVMWRGSQSHQYDLFKFASSIYSVAEKNPTYSFLFLGYKPFFLMEGLGPQGIHQGALDIFEYHKLLDHIHPKVNIVTLGLDSFNICKSNIAWIEGTLAGSVCVAPDFEEWRKPGIFTYTSKDSFANGLDSALSVDLTPALKMSEEYIWEHLRLSVVNKLRKELLESLL